MSDVKTHFSAWPLWSPHNKTLYSALFVVHEKNSVVLMATGLKPYKVRGDATEIVVPQTVCVHRILSGFTADGRGSLPCGFIFDISSMQAEIIEDVILRTCSHPWQLTGCRNIGIIGVPGVYRLSLNDSTAIGEAQVWIQRYGNNAFAPQVQNLFFT